MLKKLGGKILLNKFRVVSLVTGHTVEQKRKVLSIKVMEKNSITSDTTAKVVSIMCLSVLLAATPIVFGNLKDRDK